MSQIVNRYGQKSAWYATVKTVPRILAVTGVIAISLECVGNGVIDFAWNSMNRGVRNLYKAPNSLKTAHTNTLFDLLPSLSRKCSNS